MRDHNEVLNRVMRRKEEHEENRRRTIKTLLTAAVCLALVFTVGGAAFILPSLYAKAPLEETAGSLTAEKTAESETARITEVESSKEAEPVVHLLAEFFEDCGMEPSSFCGADVKTAIYRSASNGTPDDPVETDDDTREGETVSLINSRYYREIEGMTCSCDLYYMIMQADDGETFVIYAAVDEPEVKYDEYVYEGVTWGELSPELNELMQKTSFLEHFIPYVEKLRDELASHPDLYSYDELIEDLKTEMNYYGLDKSRLKDKEYLEIYVDLSTEEPEIFLELAKADLEKARERMAEINGIDLKIRAAYYNDCVKVDISPLGEGGIYVFEDGSTVYAYLTKAQLKLIPELINTDGITFYSAANKTTR